MIYANRFATEDFKFCDQLNDYPDAFPSKEKCMLPSTHWYYLWTNDTIQCVSSKCDKHTLLVEKSGRSGTVEISYNEALVMEVHLK
jgi:hypothetical protein